MLERWGGSGRAMRWIGDVLEMDGDSGMGEFVEFREPQRKLKSPNHSLWFLTTKQGNLNQLSIKSSQRFRLFVNLSLHRHPHLVYGTISAPGLTRYPHKTPVFSPKLVPSPHLPDTSRLLLRHV